jgi:hypothetical protein
LGTGGTCDCFSLNVNIKGKTAVCILPTSAAEAVPIYNYTCSLLWFGVVPNSNMQLIQYTCGLPTSAYGQLAIVIYFLQLGPNPSFLAPHKILLPTRAKPLRNISDSNHNILPISPKGSCPFHKAKCISPSPEVFKVLTFTFTQKFKPKSPLRQGKLIAVSL